MVAGKAARLRSGVLCALTLLWSAAALAQSVPDSSAAIRESERVQREQEQRRQEQLQRDRESARPPARLQPPSPTPSGTASAGAACRDIREVVIDGMSKLPREMRDDIARRYQGRCLAAGDVEQLLGELTKAYIDRGYVAARAYLPAQDLSGGTLRIVVVEGRLSKIEVRGKPGSINTGTAFPMMVGKPINLRKVEQGLDQVNRLASNNAKIDMEPGAGEGDTVLVVNNTPTRRLRGNFTFDNLGSHSTGEKQGSLTGSLDDILGLNEFVSFTRRQSSPFNDDDLGRSSSESYFVSLPYGPLTLSGGLTDSRYRTATTSAAGTTFVLTGGSKNRFATVDLVAKRGRTGQLGLSATLTSRDNENYLDGTRLDVSSRKLTVLDLDARGQTSRFGGFATLGLGVSFGLTWFGAENDAAGLARDVPRAQFVKYRLNASYSNGTSIGAQRVELSSSLSAQYANHPLFGSDQFSIGGAYSVRGFRETTIADDNGFYLRNDLAFPRQLARLKGTDLVWRPYLGADVGYAHGHVDNGGGGTLAGGALGSTLSFGRAFVDLFATKRFAAPDRLKNEGIILFGRMAIRI